MCTSLNLQCTSRQPLNNRNKKQWLACKNLSLFLLKNRASSMKHPTGAFRLLFILLLCTEKISSEFLKDDNGNKYSRVKSESAPADGCLGQDILEDKEGQGCKL